MPEALSGFCVNFSPLHKPTGSQHGPHEAGLSPQRALQEIRSSYLKGDLPELMGVGTAKKYGKLIDDPVLLEKIPRIAQLSDEGVLEELLHCILR